MTHPIQIERLTTSTLIEVPGFGVAEVYGVEFYGEGYGVTYCTNDRAGWDALDSFYVPAGGSVEFAGIGEPVLRAESAVTRDEWDARKDAIFRGNLEAQGRVNALQGHVCREIDETALTASVADAIGVPALSEVA